MFAIEDIKNTYMRADAHSKYWKEVKNEESTEVLEVITRKVEAFLIQAALLEGILCEISIKAMGDKFPCVSKKRNTYYGLNGVIDDLYLLKIISDDQFKQLNKFKKARNKYFHGLLKQKPNKLEGDLGKEYDNFQEITWEMVKKLEKISKK